MGLAALQADLGAPRPGLNPHIPEKALTLLAGLPPLWITFASLCIFKLSLLREETVRDTGPH